MPPLNDDDKKEIKTLFGGLFTDALGLPDGKKLTDVIGEQVNATVNAYDKRKAKEAAALEKALTEKIEALATKDDESDPDDAAGGKKKGALPPEVSQQLKDFEKRTKTLETQLEAEKKARETEKTEREKVERENADRIRVDTVRQMLAKAGITDAESQEFALDHLEHRGLVSLTEDKKAYQFKTGVDAGGEPTFTPLESGLKDWATKGVGKRFIPAVPGAGNRLPDGRPAPAGGGALSLEQLANMSAADLQKAAEAGQLQGLDTAG